MRFRLAFLRALFRLLALVPPALTGGVLAWLARRLIYPLPFPRKDVLRRNLARAFPEKSFAEREEIGRAALARLARTLGELPHTFFWPKERLLAQIAVEGLDAVQAHLAEGQGVVLCAAHHSNWELGGLALSMLGLPVHVLYRPLKQPAFNQLLLDARTRFGAKLHDRNRGIRPLLRALKKGEVVAIMVDQHVPGVPVPFLGHLALTTELPAIFARRAHAALFGVAIFPEAEPFRFRLRFWPMEVPEGANDSAILHAINRSFSEVIRADPALWLWPHWRWKWLEEIAPAAAEMVHGAP